MVGNPCIMKLDATSVHVSKMNDILTKDPELDSEFIMIRKATPLQIVDILTGEEYSTAVSGWFCNRRPVPSPYEKLFYFNSYSPPEESPGHHASYTVSKEFDVHLINRDCCVMDVRCPNGQYPVVYFYPIAYRSEDAARRLIQEDLERLEVREKVLLEAKLKAQSNVVCDCFKKLFTYLCGRDRETYTRVNDVEKLPSLKKIM
jgi:hypothetical protein